MSGKKVALDVRRNRLSVATAELLGGEIQTWGLSDGKRLNSFVPYNSALSLMVENFANGSLVTGGDGILHPYNTRDMSNYSGIDDDPDTLVRAWDPSNGRAIATFIGPGRNVTGLALSPDGRYVVASKSRDISPPPRARAAHVLAWEQVSGKLVVASDFGQTFPRAVAFSPDGRQLALEANQQLLVFKLSPALFR
jgi:WD40 repeat protein